MVIAQHARGFTLIELLVVMAIIGVLLTLAVPEYFRGLERSRESVLKQNLRTTREAIDRFHGDLGRYPESLEELVTRRYLRALPADPITGSRTTWVLLPPAPGTGGRLFDLRSGAAGRASDGTAYAAW